MATYQIPPPTPMSLQGDVVENWKELSVLPVLALVGLEASS